MISGALSSQSRRRPRLPLRKLPLNGDIVGSFVARAQDHHAQAQGKQHKHYPGGGRIAKVDPLKGLLVNEEDWRHGGIDGTSARHDEHGTESLQRRVKIDDGDQRQRSADVGQVDGKDAAQPRAAIDHVRRR